MVNSVSPVSLLLILGIVVVLFGTNRLKNVGNDLGEMVKNFRKGFEATSPDSKDEEPKKKE